MNQPHAFAPTTRHPLKCIVCGQPIDTDAHNYTLPGIGDTPEFAGQPAPPAPQMFLF